MYIKIKDLRLIDTAKEYPNGANSPTLVTRYVCPCGKGEIVERNTVGFNDHFVTLKCDECLKTYHPFIDISGFDFKLYPNSPSQKLG